MRNNYHNTLSIREAIKKFIQSPKVKKKYYETAIQLYLERSFGAYYQKYITRCYVSNNVLKMEMSSSPFKAELHAIRSELLTKINQDLGEDYIKRIDIF